MTGGLTCGRFVGVGVADGVGVGLAAGLLSAAAEVAGEADVLALAVAPAACAVVEGFGRRGAGRQADADDAGQRQHDHGADADQQATPAAPVRGLTRCRRGGLRAGALGRRPGPVPVPPAAGCTS